MPLGAMQPLIKRQRCERGPSASRCIHCKNFVRQSMGSRGADKQPGTTVGGGAAAIDPQIFIDPCHGSMFASDVNLYGPKVCPAWPKYFPGSDENYATLREPVPATERRITRATNHVAKGPTRGSRRVVVVAGNAQQHALQDVVG